MGSHASGAGSSIADYAHLVIRWMIHLLNSPYKAWVDPSAFPNDSNFALAKTPTRVHSNFIVL